MKSERQWPVAPPALPNPARLPGKQRQPCPRLALPGRICIPLSSPEQHKGCAGRQEHIAGAGVCQASQQPPALTNNPPPSPVAGAGERKGRKRESPTPLPARRVVPGAPRKTLADAPSCEQAAGFSPAELQAAPKDEVVSPESPCLRASARTQGLGGGIAVHGRGAFPRSTRCCRWGGLFWRARAPFPVPTPHGGFNLQLNCKGFLRSLNGNCLCLISKICTEFIIALSATSLVHLGRRELLFREQRRGSCSDYLMELLGYLIELFPPPTSPTSCAATPLHHLPSSLLCACRGPPAAAPRPAGAPPAPGGPV